MTHMVQIDINRFKNACVEFINASGHKVISAKVMDECVIHLQYKEAGTGDMYYTVFKPWV
jgi:hypothetical protein